MIRLEKNGERGTCEDKKNTFTKSYSTGTGNETQFKDPSDTSSSEGLTVNSCGNPSKTRVRRRVSWADQGITGAASDEEDDEFGPTLGKIKYSASHSVDAGDGLTHLSGNEETIKTPTDLADVAFPQCEGK